MSKSLLDHAFDCVSASTGPVSFQTIWEYIKKAAELTDAEAKSKVARFYTNLMLDGRFVNVGDNNWDLRSRQKFEKSKYDMNDVYNDDVTDESDEDEEEIEYNRTLLGESDEPSTESEEEETKDEEEY